VKGKVFLLLESRVRVGRAIPHSKDSLSLLTVQNFKKKFSVRMLVVSSQPICDSKMYASQRLSTFVNDKCGRNSAYVDKILNIVHHRNLLNYR
jgi:hypothetical protein